MLVTHQVTLQDTITQITVTKVVTQANHKLVVKLTLWKYKNGVTEADVVDQVVKTVGSGTNTTQTVRETSLVTLTEE
jgi:hypothetical protein